MGVIGQVLRSKFLGALIGTGVGDALGAPLEGQYEVNPEELADKLWNLKKQRAQSG